MQKLFLALLVLMGLGWQRRAPAADFSFGLGTEFPVGVHGDVMVMASGIGLYARGRYGMFLSPYTDSLNSVATGADFYNQGTADIIGAALDGAEYYELAFGYALAKEVGWRFEVSYSIARGSGQVPGSTLLAAITGSGNIPSGGQIYDIDGEVENLGLRAIYRRPLTDRQSLDFTLGLLKPLGSTTELSRETSGPIDQAILRAANLELDEYLNDVLKNDVVIPVIGLTWTVDI